jgi:hypothetical protein
MEGVRRHALLVSALPFVLVACGGAQHPPAVLRVTATDLGVGHGTVVALAHARADGRQLPLEAVLPLVPSPPPAAGRSCNGTGTVTIAFTDGRRVRYGRCRPHSIDLLQVALTAEARQWAAPPVTTTRVAARPAEVRALRALLVQMQPTRIASIAIVQVAHPSSWRLPRGALTIAVRAGPSIRGDWEGALLAARYTAAAGADGLRPIDLSAVSGTIRPVGFEPARLHLASIRRRVLGALGGDASIVELRDEGGGLAVVVRTPEPARFLKRRGRQLLAATRTPAHYVGVEDGAGAVVYAWAGLPDEGMLYARPDLDACGPIVHSEAVSWSEPPCAAR